jgi:CheY-like chemotaxis protein
MPRILIVEDESLARYVFRRMVELAGHEATEAADGEQAVQAIRQQPADLVICDLLLPGQSGLETIRTIHSEFPAVPVVAVSGGTDLPEARKAGATAILSKPFRLQELLDILGRLPNRGT